MFAVLTPAIISGAVVGRMQFRSWCIFLVIWHICVYCVMAHLVWSGWVDPSDPTGYKSGWLRGLGVLDFAGGTVVHITSGSSALAAAIILGKRGNHRKEDAMPQPKMLPWSVPLTMLGASMIWFGWYGFNAGSSLQANALAGFAFANTTIAAAAGFITWMVLESILYHKVTATGPASGSIVGLVAITPAAGFVIPGYAIIFGIVPVFFCYGAVKIKEKWLHFDDVLDAWSCHGVGGIVGAFMTGLFATLQVNPAGGDGAFYGRPILLGYQMLAITISFGLGFCCTCLILLILKYTPFFGLRVTAEQESAGLDEALHGEVVRRDTVKMVEFPKLTTTIEDTPKEEEGSISETDTIQIEDETYDKDKDK